MSLQKKVIPSTETYEGITYLYVLYSTSGYFKIGISKDPDKRLKQLHRGTLTPFENKYLCLTPYSDKKAAEMESLMHQRFHNKRVNGEWFNLDPFDIAFLTRMEAKISDYWIKKIVYGL